MKQLLLSTLLLLNTIFAFSQITINASNMPVIGLTIEQGIDTMPNIGLQPGGTGLNSWDFSDLEDRVVNNLHFLSPTGLPFANKFPGATIAVGFDNTYQFLQLTNQNLRMLGNSGNYQVDDSTQISICLTITPPQTMLKLPATYNQAFTETNLQVIQLPFSGLFDSLRVEYNVQRTVKIDAYGNMKTPAGQFNTLRVKEHRVSIDSSFAYIGGTWLLINVTSVPDTSVSYSWWGMFNGYAFPVAELEMDPSDLDHHVLSATFVKNISTATKEVSPLAQWRLYPNPAADFVNIEWPENENMNGARIEVYDVLGKLMLEQYVSGQPERLNLGTLKPNMYVVVLKARDGRIVGVKMAELR